MHTYESERETVKISRDLTIGISTLVLGCFFLSGLTGLIYEILWTRMVVKVIGSAPFAVSIILTVFMGGLGLGSYLASRMVDRIETPRLLRIYALLELAIGGYGIVLPGFIIAFKPLYSILYNQFFNHFLLYNLLILIGCAILFLIPVTCMGATLPVLCRFYVVQLGHLGTRAGRLYALNTIGAALGSLLCGFWLINLWGVWGSLVFAVLLNGLIGGVCLLVSYRAKAWPVISDHSAPGSKEKPLKENIPERDLSSYSSGNAVGALLIFAISGFCAMAYEVIWTRLLGLIIGPTTYSFTMVLATFIIGLALGSMIFGWLADRVKNPLWFLLFTQLVAAFLALGISQLLGNSQFFFAKLIYHFKDHFAQLSLIKAVMLFVLMLGPTLCLGATFPLVGKIYTQSLAKVGRSIGFAYAINTLGAVLGSFCAGFLLIPWLGKEQSLSLVVGIQLLTFMVIAGYLLWEKKGNPIRWISLGATALLGLILCCNFPSWNRQSLSMGKYHRFGDLSPELGSSGWLESLWRGSKILAKYQLSIELLYYGDGIGGFTTVVKETDALGTTQYTLLNTGKSDASSRGDMPTQVLSTHLPLIFHPNPKEVMVLGLASGITAGEVLYYPIERLDIIEISQEVVTASNFFIPWNNKVLSHPKTELIIQDGRAHLELTDRTYDVIISEPSNPWMAGLASLFTKEFFLLAKNRLKKDGIFVQFLHSYQMDWPTFSLVIRTFSQVFPRSLLAATSPGGGDFLLVGFKGENRLNINHAVTNISYARQSKNVALTDPRVLYRIVLSEDLQRLCGPGPIHSDNRPHLEFAAPKQMYTDDPAIGINIRSKKWLSQETQTILQETENTEGQIAFATFALSVYRPFPNMVNLRSATPEQKERFSKIMENYCANSLIEDYTILTDPGSRKRCLSAQIATLQNNLPLVPDKSIAYNHLGNAFRAQGQFRSAVESYQKAMAENPSSASTHNNLGNLYLAKGMFKESISEFKKTLALKPSNPDVLYNLALAYYKKGMLDEAITEYKKALTIKVNDAEAHGNLGMAYGKKGMLDEAITEYKKALAINANYADAHYNLGNAYVKKGRLDEAIVEYNKALAINPQLTEVYTNLGIAYHNKGNEAKSRYSFGNAYYRKGLLDKAIAEYKNALAIDPKLTEVHTNLAVAYYYQRNYKLAIVHCDKVIELGGKVNPKLLELLKPYR